MQDERENGPPRASASWAAESGTPAPSTPALVPYGAKAARRAPTPDGRAPLYAAQQAGAGRDPVH